MRIVPPDALLWTQNFFVVDCAKGNYCYSERIRSALIKSIILSVLRSKVRSSRTGTLGNET